MEMNQKNNIIKMPKELAEFAFLPNFKEKIIADLAAMAIQEDWTRKGSENCVLINYLLHTYKRLAVLYNEEKDPSNAQKWICVSSDKKYACFNTGLFTPNYNQIFALFYKNPISNKQPYKFKGFYIESAMELVSFYPLPSRASYFKNIDELLFNPNFELRLNLSHILDDEENFKRIPEQYQHNSNLQILLSGALELAKKRISANYNIAVPQYYEGYLQLLIPLALGADLSKTDLVLAISRHNGFYLGKTCLTVEMAYNNARLIAKPDAPWINC